MVLVLVCLNSIVLAEQKRSFVDEVYVNVRMKEEIGLKNTAERIQKAKIMFSIERI